MTGFPVGAVISGASTLLSGGLDLFGTNKAANKQLQGVRETNATNYKIAQENNQFNAEQVDKQNEYNSAVNQRKRLEEAGLNPYLMLDGGSAGTASSAAVADESGKSVAPDIGNTIASGYQTFGNSIQSAASQISQQAFQQNLQDAQVSKVRNEAVGKGIENDFAVALLAQKLQSLKYSNKISEQQYNYLSRTLSDRISAASIANKESWSRIAVNDSQFDKNKVESTLLATQQQIEKTNLKWLPSEKQASLAATLQNTLTSASQMRLNNAQAKNSLAMAALNWAQENGIRIDNYVKDSVSDLSIGLVENQYDEGRAKASQANFGMNLGSTQSALWNTSGNVRQVKGKERNPSNYPRRFAKKSKIKR